ncbi:MAG TPA: hypothetical protein VMW69_03835, partial [Spirochaetia bacterium]|nr:hypothetical protein [Spirochaetia bacterium]
MKTFSRLFAGCGSLLLIAGILTSCTTVNRLDRFRVDGSTISANLRVPPEPKFDVHYSVHFDSRNPVGTALSIGTNIAMAAEAQRAQTRMRDALLSIDVPSIVLDETYNACAEALDARKIIRKYQADYLLDVEIGEYGIRADSPNGAVSLTMRLTARLYDNKSGDLVWRRAVSVDDRATPYMFGVGDLLGNVVTAGVLAN